jgi:hypothetical protein
VPGRLDRVQDGQQVADDLLDACAGGRHGRDRGRRGCL